MPKSAVGMGGDRTPLTWDIDSTPAALLFRLLSLKAFETSGWAERDV